MKSNFPEAAQMEKRELKIQELIAVTLKIWAQRPWAIVLIVLMVHLPANLIVAYFQGTLPTTYSVETFAQDALPFVGWSLGMLLFKTLAQTFGAFLVGSELFENRHISFNELLTRAATRYPRALWTTAIIIIGIFMGGGFVLGMIMLMPASGVVILPVALAVYLYAMFLLNTAVPLSVLAKTKGMAAMSLNRTIFGDSMLKNIGRFLLGQIIFGLPGIMVSVVLSYFVSQIEAFWPWVILLGVCSTVCSFFTVTGQIYADVILYNRDMMYSREVKIKLGLVKPEAEEQAEK